MIITTSKPKISGKTAFQMVHREYAGRSEVMQYLRSQYHPFDYAEFIEEAIKHDYRLPRTLEVLKTGDRVADSDLLLLVGKKYGCY